MDEDRRLDPIGVFDSGVGGLSVLKVLREEMPEEPVIYVGDQTHVPYGPRSLQQVRDFSEGITNFLIGQGAKIIVVACNAASAAALVALRRSFDQIQFVGMEPAIKPAAEQTATRVVGVLATPATFQGALYASVLERFATGVEILQSTCPGLVQQIEKGDLEGAVTRKILEDALQPMREKNVDTVVLACTHYPFVIPQIKEIVGKQVRVIDPAPAVVRQTRRLLERGLLKHPGNVRGPVQFFTSGAPSFLERLLPKLYGEQAVVHQLDWEGDKLLKPAIVAG
jgi:glutamate racemase